MTRALLSVNVEEHRNLNEMVSLEYAKNWTVQHDGVLRGKALAIIFCCV
jgi:hypothetical protein